MAATRYSELIVDKNSFLSLSQECNKVFDTTCRLPDLVFRTPSKQCYAFAHAYIFMKGFPMFLDRLADTFSDEKVNYMNLESGPVEYFKHSGFYGLASFEKRRLREQYLKVMIGDAEVRADSFAANGHRGVIWGSLLEWGMCCDRISWELCVMGASRRVDESIMGMLKCMDSAALASYIKNEYRHEPSVAAGFLKEFAANYPNLYSE